MPRCSNLVIGRLLGVGAARPSAVVRPAHVRHRHRLRLLQRLAVHTVAYTVCFDSRLHGICVVPDSVWVGGAGDSLHRGGGVEGIDSLAIRRFG